MGTAPVRIHAIEGLGAHLTSTQSKAVISTSLNMTTGRSFPLKALEEGGLIGRPTLPALTLLVVVQRVWQGRVRMRWLLRAAGARRGNGQTLVTLVKGFEDRVVVVVVVVVVVPMQARRHRR
jgi:hypothetical protein